MILRHPKGEKIGGMEMHIVGTGITLVVSVCLVGCSPSANAPNEADNVIRGNKSDNAENVVAEASMPSREGPFGIAMGQPVSELDLESGQSSDATQARLLASVPNPVAEIQSYAVVAFPTTGVCEIRAISRTFDSDAYGVNVRSAIDAMANLVTSKYGKAEKSDDCTGYSCQFFQMNLKDGSQVYAYEWSRDTGARLPEDIRSIALVALPGQYNDTFYRLDYISSAADECDAERQKLKASAL